MAQIMMLLILFQSCTIYRSTPITLDQAVKNEYKVKVITKTSGALKFKRIGVENGDYYGLIWSRGETIRIPLKEENIISVQEKNKTLSNLLVIALPVALTIGFANMFGDEPGWKSDGSFQF
ncbi:hypothetical protein [Tamlana flava]|uniref:hypothetical protein n=1 Tax=Tamlana flava TaxID=3158572 RepID=UPI00351BA7D7